MTDEIFDSVRKHLNQQDIFGTREVGVTHPDNGSFVRIKDDGSIELVAGGETSIILDVSGVVSINADVIKLHTRAEGGFRWNKVAFNERAVGFSEPTFIEVEDTLDIKSIYRGVDYYTDGAVPASKFSFKDPNTGETISLEEYASRFAPESYEEDDEEPVAALKPNSLREI